MEAPNHGNQITAEYYFCLVGQINRGTCPKSVTKIWRQNGTYSYHLAGYIH